MSDPMVAFDKKPPPPGDEYEEIREQVSFREVYDLIHFISFHAPT